MLRPMHAARRWNSNSLKWFPVNQVLGARFPIVPNDSILRPRQRDRPTIWGLSYYCEMRIVGEDQVPNAYSRRRRERFRRVLQCFQFTDFEGKRVLEIAGNDTEVAEYLLSLGATSVTIINLSQFYPDGEVKPGIFFRRVDARKLCAEFGEKSFDVVFGNAILEHLSDMDKALAECSRALTEGGLLFLSGHALWSSSIGHHIWVIGQGMNYRFTDATNPIPPHAHLLLGKRGLSDHLRERGIPASHIDAILHWTFHDDDINRVGYRRTVQAFRDSGLQVADVATVTELVPDDRLDRLREIDAIEDYSVLGMNIASFVGEGERIRRFFQASTKAYQIAPYRAEWALCYAEVLLFGNRLDDAEIILRIALDLDGDLVKSHERLSEILERKGQHAEASLVIKRAVERWPFDSALRAHESKLRSTL